MNALALLRTEGSMQQKLALEPPWPLWLVVCRVLQDHSAGGVSVTRCAAEVQRITGGRYARTASVSKLLAGMRRAGLCRARMESHGDRIPSKMHTLTPAGVRLLREGVEQVDRLLSLSNTLSHQQGRTHGTT
jgi:DNA-binding PadR family transcriptional regulator